MATDWVSGSTAGHYIFIGHAPLGGVQNLILRYDPNAGTSETYSLNITPSYTEPDSNGVVRTWTTYVGPLGLGYNPATGELYVGDDPQFTAAVPVLQQGHFWSVPHPATVVLPTVTAIAPTSGTTLGGDLVTITGTNFSLTATTINFGANPATGVICATTTSCTATSPAGTGIVDVTAVVAGQTSANHPSRSLHLHRPCQ